jgi:hypothetical protein
MKNSESGIAKAGEAVIPSLARRTPPSLKIWERRLG